jgi:hypothetical protein
MHLSNLQQNVFTWCPCSSHHLHNKINRASSVNHVANHTALQNPKVYFYDQFSFEKVDLFVSSAFGASGC